MRFVPKRILRCRLAEKADSPIRPSWRRSLPAIRYHERSTTYDRAERTKRTRFCSFVGIDWADQKHAWALQTPTQRTVESGDLNQTPEGVDAWATELGRRFGGRPIAIALDQSRGALLFMLTKYAHFVLYPIQPNTLVNYRRGFRPSGAKSDPSDATMLLDLLVRHREKLRRLNPDTVETRTWVRDGRLIFERVRVDLPDSLRIPRLLA